MVHLAFYISNDLNKNYLNAFSKKFTKLYFKKVFCDTKILYYALNFASVCGIAFKIIKKQVCKKSFLKVLIKSHASVYENFHFTTSCRHMLKSENCFAILCTFISQNRLSLSRNVVMRKINSLSAQNFRNDFTLRII